MPGKSHLQCTQLCWRYWTWMGSYQNSHECRTKGNRMNIRIHVGLLWMMAKLKKWVLWCFSELLMLYKPALPVFTSYATNKIWYYHTVIMYITYHIHLPVMISCVLIVGSAATFSRMSWMTLEGILDALWSGWLWRLLAWRSPDRLSPDNQRHLSSWSSSQTYTNSTLQSPPTMQSGWFGCKGHFSSQVEATKEQSAVHILAPAHGAIRYHSSSCVPSTSKVTLRALRGFPFPSWMSESKKCSSMLV